jgi:hypothetical protein
MTTEVLECINLKKEAFDKWLSSKQVAHKELYKKRKTTAKAVTKENMKCGLKQVQK